MATSPPFFALQEPASSFAGKLATYESLMDPSQYPNFRLPETLLMAEHMERPAFLQQSEYGFVSAVIAE